MVPVPHTRVVVRLWGERAVHGEPSRVLVVLRPPRGLAHDFVVQLRLELREPPEEEEDMGGGERERWSGWGVKEVVPAVLVYEYDWLVLP